MKKKIIGLTVSKNDNEKKMQENGIEWYTIYSDYDLQGIVHLSYNFSSTEMISVLQILKRHQIAIILLDVSELSIELIKDIKKYLDSMEFELVAINRKGIYPSDKCLFISITRNQAIDIEVLTKVILNDSIKEIHVLLDNFDVLQNKFVYKLKSMSKILNIDFHIYVPLKDELSSLMECFE